MTLLNFQLIIIITVTDTGRIFEPIFMKFTWLVWLHTWVNQIFFGNNQSNRTTDMEENVPPKLVFWLSFSPYGVFWGKNFKVVFGSPFPIEKIIFIFFVQCPIPWKMVMTTKIFSFPGVIFENIDGGIEGFRMNSLKEPIDSRS